MTREEAIKILSSESYIGNSALDDAIEYAIEALSEPAKTEPTTITENMTNGLEEGIRCAMCTNSMKSDRGCDGGCVVDNVMYKKVMDTIHNHIFRDKGTIKALEQEPFINNSCVYIRVCEHNKNKVFDKIRAEIEKKYPSCQCTGESTGYAEAVEDFLQIIDKYKAESEE